MEPGVAGTVEELDVCHIRVSGIRVLTFSRATTASAPGCADYAVAVDESVEDRVSVPMVKEVNKLVSVVDGGYTQIQERFLNEFKAAYAEDPLYTTALLPTSAVARRIRGHLIRDLGSIVESSITTLDALAMERLAGSPGAKLLLDQIGSEMIIRELLQDRGSELPLFYDGPNLREGLVSPLRSFISTLLDFRVDYPSCLGELQSEKSTQIGKLFSWYLQLLKERNLLDGHQLMEWLAGDLMERPGERRGTLLVFGLYDPTPAEKTAVSALCKCFRKAVCFTMGGVDPVFEQDLSWLEVEGREFLGASERDLSISSVFSSERTNTAPASVMLSNFSDPLEEMRAVGREIRRLMDSGEDPSTIAVFLPMKDRMAPFVRQAFRECEIPGNIRVGIPFAQSPLVQDAEHLLEMIDGDFRTSDVIELLSSPFFRFTFRCGDQEVQLKPWEVRTAVKICKVGEHPRWTELECTDDVREEMLELVKRIRSGMTALVNSFHTMRAPGHLSDHYRRLREALEVLGLKKNLYFSDDEVMERNSRSCRLYLQFLRDAERSSGLIKGTSTSFKEFVSIHYRQVRSEIFMEEVAVQGRVHVSGLRAGQLLPFKSVFIPGMVDGDIPYLEARYPLATSEEAERMGVLTHVDRLRQERYYFLQAMLGGSNAVYLSHPRSVEGRPTIRSMFLLSLEGKLTIKTFPENDVMSVRDIQIRTGGALAGRTTELSQRVEGMDLDRVCRSINIEQYLRSGPYSSEFDGIISGNIQLEHLNGFLENVVHSPTSLETYMYCPYQYMLRYICRVRPWEDDDEGSPTRTGIIWHRILARFYRERAADGLGKVTQTEMESALNRLRDIAREEIITLKGLEITAKWNQIIGDDHYKGQLGCFIAYESENKLPTLSPRWFEVAFDEGGLDEPGKERAHVKIPLDEEGCFLRMSGRVDRVDADAKGNFFVLDYKTGKKPSKKAACASLQPIFYVMALQAAMPGTSGIGCGLYYLGNKANTQILPVSRSFDHMEEMIGLGKPIKNEVDLSENIENVRLLLKGFMKKMSDGRFNPSESGTVRAGVPCGPKCEYHGVCRFNELRLLDMGASLTREEEE